MNCWPSAKNSSFISTPWGEITGAEIFLNGASVRNGTANFGVLPMRRSTCPRSPTSSFIRRNIALHASGSVISTSSVGVLQVKQPLLLSYGKTLSHNRISVSLVLVRFCHSLPAGILPLQGIGIYPFLHI